MEGARGGEAKSGKSQSERECECRARRVGVVHFATIRFFGFIVVRVSDILYKAGRGNTEAGRNTRLHSKNKRVVSERFSRANHVVSFYMLDGVTIVNTCRHV